MKRLFAGILIFGLTLFGQGNGRQQRGPVTPPLEQPGASNPGPIPTQTPPAAAPGKRSGKSRAKGRSAEDKKSTQKRGSDRSIE